jgi:hydroxyacylglutathione hydrolase
MRPALLALLLCLLAAGCGAQGDATLDAGPGFTTTTPAAIAADVEAGRVLLVDVRTDGEWTAGRAPQAVHIPLAEVADRLDEIDRLRGDRPVAFICRTGRRSAQASRAAVEGGLDDVVNVDGGMGAWLRAGLPLVPPGGRVA